MWQKMVSVAVRDFFDSWIRDDIKSTLDIDRKTNVLRLDMTYKDSVVSRSEIPLANLFHALSEFKIQADKEAPSKREFIAILYDQQNYYGPLTWESPVRGDQAVRLYNKYLRVIEFTTETDAGKKLETGYYDFYVTKEEFDYYIQTL